MGGFVLDCLKAAQSVFIFDCLKAAQSVMSFLDASIQGNPCCHRWSHKKSIIYSVTLEWLKPAHSILPPLNDSVQHNLFCHLWMPRSSTNRSIAFGCFSPEQSIPSSLNSSVPHNPFCPGVGAEWCDHPSDVIIPVDWRVKVWGYRNPPCWLPI